MAKKRGPKPVTGNYKTRTQLVKSIKFLYRETSCSIQRIAQHCGVSAWTVNNIINNGR